MKKDEKEELDRLTSIIKATPSDKKSALKLFNKYVDNKSKFCLTCSGSVRILFKQLRTWWRQKKQYQFIKPLDEGTYKK